MTRPRKLWRHEVLFQESSQLCLFFFGAGIMSEDRIPELAFPDGKFDLFFPELPEEYYIWTSCMAV